MNDKKLNRRKLREKALQVLYAYEMNREGLELLLNGVLADVSSEADREFTRELVSKAVVNQKALDELIKEKVANWEMDRIALIDRLLLRIAITELMHFPDIPPKVSINEVIEIAKIYSTAKSGKFVNGILDAILSELKSTGKLNKTGRGLIEESLSKKDSGKE